MGLAECEICPIALVAVGGGIMPLAERSDDAGHQPLCVNVGETPASREFSVEGGEATRDAQG